MMRRLRLRLGHWVIHRLCAIAAVKPEWFAPWSCVADEVEVRIEGNTVWINTAAGCQYRAKATKRLTLEGAP